MKIWALSWHPNYGKTGGQISLGNFPEQLARDSAEEGPN